MRNPPRRLEVPRRRCHRLGAPAPTHQSPVLLLLGLRTAVVRLRPVRRLCRQRPERPRRRVLMERRRRPWRKSTRCSGGRWKSSPRSSVSCRTTWPPPSRSSRPFLPKRLPRRHRRRSTRRRRDRKRLRGWAIAPMTPATRLPRKTCRSTPRSATPARRARRRRSGTTAASRWEAASATSALPTITTAAPGAAASAAWRRATPDTLCEA
mmetsp:Transcript_38483/g.118956  ORF Transcript_38483/g.118956 Transcript_38483/m.118956 type:complete len:209 (+) Transcript_38483:1471-2097(+)